MSDRWYPVTEKHPEPLVQVRGIVEMPGHKSGFDAHVIVSRGRHPHTDKWAEWVKGKAVPLPPDAVVSHWQPQHPDKWQAPLPPPVLTAAGQMTTERTRFQAVEEASAAELAAEMERDRELARSGGSSDEMAGKEPLPWWFDATTIRYERAGAVTPRMAEGRVMRAVALSAHGQGMTITENSFGKILADMAAAGEHEKRDPTSDYVARLYALPQDHDDFLVAMSWFVALNPVELRSKRQQRYATWGFSRVQLLLIWRSFGVPLSFDVIGERLSMTGEGARKAYKSAIGRCVSVANGLPAYSHLPKPEKQIEALQERNRKARLVA